MSAQLLAELERIYMLEINSEEYDREIVRFSILHHSALLQALRSQGEPVALQRIIAALEGSSANTDTDPRWLAANELRNITHWESVKLTLPAPPNERTK